MDQHLGKEAMKKTHMNSFTFCSFSSSFKCSFFKLGATKAICYPLTIGDFIYSLFRFLLSFTLSFQVSVFVVLMLIYLKNLIYSIFFFHFLISLDDLLTAD